MKNSLFNIKEQFVDYHYLLRTTINHLQYKAFNGPEYLAMIHNLPSDFEFEPYKTVWSYKAAPIHKSNIEIDIFARANQSYSLIGEVKNRKDRKFSKDEAIEFENKAKELIKLENVNKAALFVFSLAGFTQEACIYMKEAHIAWTQDEQWLNQE